MASGYCPTCRVAYINGEHIALPQGPKGDGGQPKAHMCTQYCWDQCALCGSIGNCVNTHKCLYQSAKEKGVWFAYHTDYSAFGVFATEIEALRYAVGNSITFVEFREFGAVRGGAYA